MSDTPRDSTVQARGSPPLLQQSSPSSSQGRRKGRTDKVDGATTTLACKQCRLKKVKCVLEESGCKRCNRLGVDCMWQSQDQRKCPSSKSHNP
ncbi:hypothetical protein GE09DRAFT_385798 [Coniochaeta sp. 2T2.1]|nr:hypothetical protein GE09DRAFT_385798 [Coniochaeta sp. 2T2.1]